MSMLLPSMRDIAENLRNGEDLTVLAKSYDIAEHALVDRLNYAGYASTGEPLYRDGTRYEPIDPAVYGGYVSGGVGGGDYRGLPVHPVPHTRRRREFLGLDWSRSPAVGPLWVEV